MPLGNSAEPIRINFLDDPTGDIVLVEPPGVHISEQALKEICRHDLTDHIEDLVGAQLVANLPHRSRSFWRTRPSRVFCATKLKMMQSCS